MSSDSKELAQVSASYREQIEAELAAQVEGYVPDRDELVLDLGEHSTSGSRMLTYAENAHVGQQLTALIRQFTAALPSPTPKAPPTYTHQFEFAGLTAPHKARQVQANVLWLPHTDDAGVAKFSRSPHYILGRSVEAPETKHRKLLLAQAGPWLTRPGMGKQYDVNYPLVTALVRTDDARAFKSVAERISSQEFTEAELEQHIDRATGNLVIRSTSPNSITLVNNGWREKWARSSEAHVASNGLRLAKDHIRSFDRVDVLFPHEYQAMNVTAHLVKLAIAFGAETGLQTAVRNTLTEV